MKAMHTKLVLSALALVLVAGCASSGPDRFARMDNKQFYDAGGKFDAEVAKRVYLDFLKQRGYPVNDTIAQKLFVTDFSLGRFTDVGLAAIIWWGDEKHNFTGLDAFLLPGQIIPEHWHVKVRDIPEKMEATSRIGPKLKLFRPWVIGEVTLKERKAIKAIPTACTALERIEPKGSPKRRGPSRG